MGIQYHLFDQLIKNELDKNPKEILLISNLSLFLHKSEVKQFEATPFFKNKQLFLDYKFGEYANKLLEKIFPNSNIDILDHSDYENANLIADLNLNLSDTLTKRYDLIIEGGTLEHIFNFPQAVSNINDLLKIDGTLYLCTPANNQCGHGFYQFSPELFFRLYNEENGFKLNMIQLFGANFPSVELTKNKYLATPIDPSLTGRRNQFLSSHPVMMVISASKLSERKTEIQQSDYELKWKAVADGERSNFLKQVLKNNLPLGILNLVKGFYERRVYSFRNRDIFKN